ncbi:conserved hypothetical protein [Ricinus communis]|uniref:Uncharacterized protein n=1 Tax=Ricinus communis TaxID=3988 RepID=B9RZ03_RICCO|nr:conserved hypothetical protein [Ricinus communis]
MVKGSSMLRYENKQAGKQLALHIKLIGQCPLPPQKVREKGNGKEERTLLTENDDAYLPLKSQS